MRRHPLAWSTVGVVTLAVAGVALQGPPARAAAEPGSRFSALDLSAVGGGARVLFTRDGTAEADVPYAEATMKTGPRAHALSSITWPGAIAANLGNALVLVGNPVPGAPGYPKEVEDTLTEVRYPVRAEAQSGGGETTVKNDDVPGTAMTARATREKAAAEARFAGAEAPSVGKLGATRSLGTTELTGPASAVSQARSVVKDVSLVGGQVTIGAVTSVAKATTDGKRSKATGRTDVTDMKVAGVPVTVDEDGVHVAGQGGSAEDARKAVKTALDGTGLQIRLTESTATTDGPSATSDAASLLIVFPQDGPVLALGGARAHASGLEGDPFSLGADTPVADPPAAPAGGDTPVSSGGSGKLSSSDTPAMSTGGSEEPKLPEVAASGPQAPAGRLAPGVPPGWYALAVLGALLTAAGAMRVPQLLAQTPAASCTDGDQR